MRLFWLVLLIVNIYFICQPGNDVVWLNVAAAVISTVYLFRDDEDY